MLTREKLNFLQVFRAIAASLVVFSHMGKEIMHRAGWNGNPIFEHTLSFVFGVDLFFVISGFIMVYTTRNAVGGPADASSFLTRRLIRIVPVYWLYMTLFVLMIVLTPSELAHTHTSAAHIIGSYLFWPVPWPDTGSVSPVFALGWTLNYEMFFYVVFSVLLLAPQRYLITMLTVLFVGLFVVGHFVPEAWSAPWYWTRSNILEFLFGAWIAKLFLWRVTISRQFCLLSIAVGVVAWQWTYIAGAALEPAVRGIYWGIPAALIVGGVALCPPVRDKIASLRWMKPVIAIGDSSYSLYLAHMFVVRAATLLVPASLFGVIYPFVFIPVTFLAVAGVSYCSYIWFELPVQNLGKRIFLAKTLAPAR